CGARWLGPWSSLVRERSGSREWMGMEPTETDYQKQFQAAVRVIQGLPKNGWKKWVSIS
uniref:Uncharacterized protein n=1 Tax=Terrapene triunguis TaxID=2587831 RepID=A0A674JFA9_9SAUR